MMGYSEIPVIAPIIVGDPLPLCPFEYAWKLTLGRSPMGPASFLA